jgi:hypothetical protein
MEGRPLFLLACRLVVMLIVGHHCCAVQDRHLIIATCCFKDPLMSVSYPTCCLVLAGSRPINTCHFYSHD